MMLHQQQQKQQQQRSVNIAVQGCAHGDLDSIYQEIVRVQTTSGKQVDLLIISGDFESMRDILDLQSLAAPEKYKHLNDFQDYVSGRKRAPVLTIFIGGNHEASNVLQSLYYGGWVAPQIYFMGFSGVVVFNGIRIAGISGIFDKRNYKSGHFERPPYDASSLRSVYHTRQFEEYKLMHFCKSRKKVDICVSHDWPKDIWNYGDKKMLLKQKPFLRQDIDDGELGSPINLNLLKVLQPTFWFSAHMHVKFAAVVPHHTLRPLSGPEEDRHNGKLSKAGGEGSSGSSSADDVSFDFLSQGNWQMIPSYYLNAPTCFDDSISMSASSKPSSSALGFTRFLSLDKVVPGRDFLQFLTIPVVEQSETVFDNTLHYDEEWLAIVKATHSFFNTARHAASLPITLQLPTNSDIEETKQRFIQINGDLRIPYIDPPLVNHSIEAMSSKLGQEGNIQTDLLLEALRLEHAWTIPLSSRTSSKLPPPPPPTLFCPENADTRNMNDSSNSSSHNSMSSHNNSNSIHNNSNNNCNEKPGDQNEIDIDDI